MTADDEMLEALGLWECGHCHRVTDTTHFYEDRATGTMQHCADSAQRRVYADRCGSRWDDGYVMPYRCVLRHRHSGNHRTNPPYPVRWDDGPLSWGVIPPAVPLHGVDR